MDILLYHRLCKLTFIAVLVNRINHVIESFHLLSHVLNSGVLRNCSVIIIKQHHS